MRKLALSLIMGLLLSCWAGSQTAQAQFSGFYIEPKFMYSYQHLSSPTLSFGSLGLTNGGSKGDSTWGGALAFGYNFHHFYNAPLRLEIEYAMRSRSDLDWSGRAGATYYRNTGKIDVDTLFLNVYWDIATNSAFTPYIGAGLGFAFVDSTYKFQMPDVNVNVSDDRTNFAWNVGAGLGYGFDEHWTASLGYRFSSFGEAKAERFSYTPPGVSEHLKGKGDLYGHEISLGLRYSF